MITFSSSRLVEWASFESPEIPGESTERSVFSWMPAITNAPRKQARSESPRVTAGLLRFADERFDPQETVIVAAGLCSSPIRFRASGRLAVLSTLRLAKRYELRLRGSGMGTFDPSSTVIEDRLAKLFACRQIPAPTPQIWSRRWERTR